MHRNLTTFAFIAITALGTSYAQGQIEQIGPLILVPNQPVNFFFTNFIPPNPDYKEFHFRGLASVPAGLVGTFRIDFDYIDASGMPVLVPSPNSPYTVIGGAPTPIDSGILRLPFCPRDVSLHLTNTTTANFPIEIRGLYRHQCFPVPEPTSLLGSGLLAIFGVFLRMRARMSPAT